MCPTPSDPRQPPCYPRPLARTHSSASRVIGIAGPSGSGKSTLARGVAAAFSGESPVLLSLDAYYRGIDNPWFPAGEEPNFDTPAALDWDLATQQVRTLRSGEAIAAPTYDFATHLRRPTTTPLGPSRVILIEGILALHHPELVGLLDDAVYVDAPPDICLKRRLRRDTLERGRSRQSVLDQWQNTVHPMMERYVFPQGECAHFRADGIAPIDEMIATTLAWLRG